MSVRYLPLAAILLCFVSSARAVTVQGPGDVLPDGSAFLFVEAETAAFGGDDPAIGFVPVNKENPIKSIDTAVKGGLDVLPKNTNASGGAAIFDELGGGLHANTATWELQFATPATYHVYVHASMYNSDGNTTYGNEDSFFMPPSFNVNTSDSWLEFKGVDQDGNELIGDSVRDGWMPVFNNKQVISAGETEVHNSTDEDYWDGTFHWMFAGVAVDVNSDNGYIDDFGQVLQYKIAAGDVGKTQTFEISTREPYGVIDALVFSTSNEMLQLYRQDQMDGFFLNRTVVPGDFDMNGSLDLPDVNALNAGIAAGTNDAKLDLNADAAVNAADLDIWVKSLKKTWFGDANLNREFNSGDLVTVFQAGKYEQGGTQATWDQGDWNGDLKFDSGDLVKAFQDGGYEAGPPAVTAVPEPTGFVLYAMGLAIIGLRRSSRR